MAGRENVTNVNVHTDSRNTEKNSVDNENCFVQKGYCDDEVTLKFDDDKELYVSASFLIYASPVFKAMLTSDFKEKKSNIVKLTGKRYDDMLMFLKFMHPGISLKLTTTNVAIIATLAEEYQIDTIIASCKEVMTIWLRRGCDFREQDLFAKVPDRHPQGSESFFTCGDSGSIIYHEFNPNIRFSKDVNVCLEILHIVSQLNFSDIETEAVSILSNIPHKYISGEFNEPNIDAAVVSENQKLYKDLPHNMKVEILESRLGVCDP